MKGTDSQVLSSPHHERLERLNDEFACVRRLLNKPEVVMAAPEVLDLTRLAVERIHSRYESLAHEMRVGAPAVFAAPAVEKRKPGRPKKADTAEVATPRKRTMSAEGRARIAAAARARWAKRSGNGVAAGEVGGSVAPETFPAGVDGVPEQPEHGEPQFVG